MSELIANDPGLTVFVCGHRKPDTDSAVSAVMAARLLASDYPGRHLQPILAGDPLPQTRWLFERAGEALPPVVSDVRPRAGSCCREAVAIHAETPLGEALELLAVRGISVLPVVDAENALCGLLSPRKAEAQFLFHLNVEDFLGTVLFPGDLPGGLALSRVSGAPGALAAKAARVRIHQHGQSCDCDLVLAGGLEAAREAEADGAVAMVVCDCDASAAREHFSASRIPVWHFMGSLMALATSLPRAIPVGRIMSEATDFGGVDEAIEDLVPVLSRLPHALPIVDGEGRLRGMLSQRAALTPPRPGIILVDHMEKAQAVAGLHAVEVLEILDHHRMGGLQTAGPVRIDCRPLGSTATLIALRMEERGQSVQPGEALLLLGAIVADTLLLTSPTTTPADHACAAKLARYAGVALHAFGKEVLARNDSLADGQPGDLVGRDLKEFQHGACHFLVGQTETTDLALLAPRRHELVSALEDARVAAGADFAVLMVTDVLAGQSHLLLSDPDPLRCKKLLEGGDAAEGVLCPGMVSRKKQTIPLILARLDAAPGR